MFKLLSINIEFNIASFLLCDGSQVYTIQTTITSHSEGWSIAEPLSTIIQFDHLAMNLLCHCINESFDHDLRLSCDIIFPYISNQWYEHF